MSLIGSNLHKILVLKSGCSDLRYWSNKTFVGIIFPIKKQFVAYLQISRHYFGEPDSFWHMIRQEISVWSDLLTKHNCFVYCQFLAFKTIRGTVQLYGVIQHLWPYTYSFAKYEIFCYRKFKMLSWEKMKFLHLVF